MDAPERELAEVLRIIRSENIGNITELGSGGFGKCYQIEGNPPIAIKLLYAPTEEKREARLREVRAMMEYRHPNIVELRSCRIIGNFIVIAMPKYDSSLRNRDEIIRPVSFVKDVAHDCLKALEFLHVRNVVHRDVKPENIFIKRNNSFVLGDLGTVRQVDQRLTMTNTGTCCYMAPEMMCGQRYGTKADIYSLGCTLYELAYGVFYFIESISGVSSGRLGDGSSFADLIKGMVAADPDKRWTATECLAHPFLQAEAPVIRPMTTNFNRRREPRSMVPDSPIQYPSITFSARTEPRSFEKPYLVPMSPVSPQADGLCEATRSYGGLFIKEGVKEIPEGSFVDDLSLTNVVLPSSIKSIGVGAFKGCKNIVSIELNSGLEKLGSHAFALTGIKSITIPASVIEIGDNPFSETSLEEIKVAGGNKTFVIWDGALVELPSMTLIAFPCKHPRQLLCMHEGLKRIGKMAFCGCKNIKNIKFNRELLEIRDFAFKESGLAEIYIKRKLEVCGSNPFSGCKSLKEITVSKKSKTFKVSSNCLIDKAAKTVIAYPPGCESTSVSLSPNLLAVGAEAFNTCNQVTSVTIPSSLKEIRSCAFRMTGITKLQIPNSVLVIGDFAFLGCKALKSVTFGASLEEIGEGAFNGCGLRSVVFPNSLNTIKSEAFYDNTELTNVKLNVGLKKLGGKAFFNTALIDVEVPAGIEEIQGNPFGYSQSICSFKLAKDNKRYKVVDGALMEVGRCGYRLIAYPPKREGKEFNCKSNVERIEDFAFNFCTNIKTIIIDGVEQMGWGAFMCSGLGSITIPGSIGEVATWVFYDCKALGEVVLGPGVRTLKKECFSGTQIKQITIPVSLTAITSNPFTRCEALRDIRFMGHSRNFVFENEFLINKATKTLVAYIPGFVCGEFLRVEIPSGIEVVGKGAFANSKYVRWVKLSLGLRVIKKGAFAGTSIESVVIPHTCVRVEEGAFEAHVVQTREGSGKTTKK